MPNLFLLFLSEVFVFWSLANLYGFLDVLMWYWAPTAAGLLFLTLFGRGMMMRAQKTLAQGASFSQNSLHSVTIMIGILLLLPPFIVPRVLAVTLILPGTRHLILWKFRDFVARKIQQGFQNPQGGGFRFYYKGFGNQGAQTYSSAEEFQRDVTPKSLPASEEVIDVTPIRTEKD